MATGFVDTVMMGRLGGEVIAAGGLGAMTFNFLMLASASVVSAVSPLTAAAVGAAQPQRIRDILWQGMLLAIALSGVCLVLLGSTSLWLPQLGLDPPAIALTQEYLRVTMWAIPPMLLFTALRSMVAATGQPRIVMGVVLLGTGLNVAGNYSLALGKWGLPALGLTGIALASLIAGWMMFLVLGAYVLWHPTYRHLRLVARQPRVRLAGLRDLLRIGLPIGGLAVAEGGSFTATSYLMAAFGTVTLAAHQIALQTAALTFMVPMGISMAATIRVGQLGGQQRWATARRAGQVAIALGGAFMAGMALLFWLAPTAIVSLYIDVTDPANQAVVRMAKLLLGVAAVFQVVDGIQVTAVGALRGLQDTRVPCLVGVFAYWVIGLGTGSLLAWGVGLGGTGLWWGLAIGLAVAAIALSWRFHHLIAAQPYSGAGEYGPSLTQGEL